MQVKLGQRMIGGTGDPVYIIAEVGASHERSLKIAQSLVYSAASAGADAVKFQCYAPGDMVMRESRLVAPTGPWKDTPLWDLYRRAAMPKRWIKGLTKMAHGLGLGVVVSVFKPADMPMLEDAGVDAYKIASYEIIWQELVMAAAKPRKPVILSTGMATWDEIIKAVEWARYPEPEWGPQAAEAPVIVLRCVSSYPTKPATARLRLLDRLAETHAIVGLSDHTPFSGVACAAVTLGAKVIEKHIKASEDSLDASFALDQDEFATFTADIRAATAAVCDGDFGPTCPQEVAGLSMRRSLVANCDKRPGDTLGPGSILTMRGPGIPSGELQYRRIVSYPLKAGTPITWSILS